MSTSDPSSAGGAPPPAIAATTPGLSPQAAAHVPTAPTLPSPDPASMTTVLARLANELFSATPPPAMGAPTPAGADVMPSAPHSPPAPPAGAAGAPLPSASAVPPTSPSPSTSPFSAPLDFSAIAVPVDPYAPPGGFDASVLPSLAIVDPRAPIPEVPGMPDESTVPAPAAPPAPAPVAPHALTLDAFEIAPADDPAIRSLGAPMFDPNLIKREFPILREPVRGKRLVWLDNAATTQKPQTVIDRLSYFYEHENSNVHRAAHTLAARATDAYESARESVRRFIKAPSKNEIVFVRGTTEGINLVSQSWGRRNVGPGDEIVITWLEHHANIVPWQQLCSEKGAKLRVAPVDDRGQVILEEYEKLLGPRTRIVAFTQVSNALGTITPAAEMIQMAHRHGALALLDGAQAVSHMPVDVQALGCDFFIFSGHKIFGPTGIGVVWGRKELLDTMPPWQGGGNMIQDVTFERTLYQAAPARFEAGTGNIADAVGLGSALDWLSRVGVERVERYEHGLLEYATEKLMTVPGLTMIGTAPQKAGVLSFVLDGQKTEEVGGMLDQEGIAVRSGHHCAQPILRRFGLEATVRASLAPYNTCEDIDALVDALRRIQAGRPERPRSR
ncbi:MAG TPA: family 2A encapsulin nanocompartment cargo protein cysteine desulfurase [Polyangiaceae bacterium]